MDTQVQERQEGTRATRGTRPCVGPEATPRLPSLARWAVWVSGPRHIVGWSRPPGS